MDIFSHPNRPLPYSISSYFVKGVQTERVWGVCGEKKGSYSSISVLGLSDRSLDSLVWRLDSTFSMSSCVSKRGGSHALQPRDAASHVNASLTSCSISSMSIILSLRGPSACYWIENTRGSGLSAQRLGGVHTTPTDSHARAVMPKNKGTVPREPRRNISKSRASDPYALTWWQRSPSRGVWRLTV